MSKEEAWRRQKDQQHSFQGALLQQVEGRQGQIKHC
jgi:hypothetical protein